MCFNQKAYLLVLRAVAFVNKMITLVRLNFALQKLFYMLCMVYALDLNNFC